jgi:hypothetical protein
MTGSSGTAQPAAEVLKLAHQLGVAPEQLHFLAEVPADQLRTLRQQIGDTLFDADKHHFTRVVAASKMVPSAVAAKITEHALPPLVAARTAELLDPVRAMDIVARLSDRYLADVSAAMDPYRAPEVVAGIPPATVAAVGTELARRGEWVVMGSFVSLVSHEALHATSRSLTGEQLLRVGYVLDDLSRMDEIAEVLSDRQLDELLAAAVRLELWPQLDEILAHLGTAGAQRLAGRLSAAPEEVRAAVLAAAASGLLRAESRTGLGVP